MTNQINKDKQGASVDSRKGKKVFKVKKKMFIF